MAEHTETSKKISRLRLIDFTWQRDDGVEVVEFVPGFNLLSEKTQIDRTLILRLIRYAMGGSYSRIDKGIADVTKLVTVRFTANEKIVTTNRGFKHPDGQLTIQLDGETRSLYPREVTLLLVELLDIPLIRYQRGDVKTTLSFNDIARTFVIDRDFGYTQILAGMFPEERRLAVQVIMGLTTQEIADIEEELADVSSEASRLIEQIKGIERLLTEFQIGPIEQLEQTSSALQQQLTEFQQKEDSIRRIIRETAIGVERQDYSPSEYSALRQEFIEKRSQVTEIEKELSTLEREIGFKEDLRELLASELNKLERHATSQYVLSSFTFSKCPRCLRPVTTEMRERERKGDCMLCDRQLEAADITDEAWSKPVSETKTAVREAETLLDLYRTRIEALSLQRDEVGDAIDRLQKTMAEETTKYVSPLLEDLSIVSQQRANLLSELSEIKQQIKQRQYVDSMEQIELPSLRERLEELQLHLHELQVERNRRGSRVDAFLTHFRTFMRSTASDHFETATWDHSEFLPLINDQDHTKALTAYDLVICVLGFHYSLLAMKVMPPRVDTPHPSLLIIDEPEQQKMRSTQFQSVMNHLVKLAEDYDDSVQIIVAATNKAGFEDYVRPIVFTPDL